jgi:hypothetical protein
MEQETGVRSLCDEFFRGYGAEIGLFCPDFRPNSTYKPTYTPSVRTRVAMRDVKAAYLNLALQRTRPPRAAGGHRRRLGGGRSAELGREAAVGGGRGWL